MRQSSKKLKPNKIPGPDGLIPEFYQLFWSDLNYSGVTTNIILVSEIIELCETQGLPGAIISLEFEKVFDSLNWNLMLYLFIWGFTSLSTLYRSYHDG